MESQVKSNASEVQKLGVPWLIAMYGLSYAKSLILDVIKQVTMVTATKLGLIKCCQTSAKDFPISLNDVANLASGSRRLQVGTLRAHLAGQLSRCFENYYESILKIEGAGGCPLQASFIRKFVAEPNINESLLDVAEAEVLCPTAQDPAPGERPWN
jgi:hypothetical protein